MKVKVNSATWSEISILSPWYTLFLCVSAYVEGGRGDRGEKSDLIVCCLEMSDQVAEFTFPFVSSLRCVQAAIGCYSCSLYLTGGQAKVAVDFSKSDYRL